MLGRDRRRPVKVGAERLDRRMRGEIDSEPLDVQAPEQPRLLQERLAGVELSPATKEPSRRWRRYGAGSPCSAAALAAIQAGCELTGAPSNHRRGSTGMPERSAASSISPIRAPGSP